MAHVPWDTRHFVLTVIEPLIQTLIEELELLEKGSYSGVQRIRLRPNDAELQRFVATRPALWTNLATHDDLVAALHEGGENVVVTAEYLAGLIHVLEGQLTALRQELLRAYSSSST